MPDHSEQFTALSALQGILLGIILGAFGQTIRAIVGLKKASDQADSINASLGDVFDGPRLAISLLLGATAGALAVLPMLGHLATLTVQDLSILLAAGYAGADFIEGFMRKALPSVLGGASGDGVEGGPERGLAAANPAGASGPSGSGFVAAPPTSVATQPVSARTSGKSLLPLRLVGSGGTRSVGVPPITPGLASSGKTWTITRDNGAVVTVTQDQTGRVSWVSGATVDADGSNGQNGNTFAYRIDDRGTDRLADAGYPDGQWTNVLLADATTGEPLSDGQGNLYSQTTYFWAKQPVQTRFVDASTVPYIVVNPLVRSGATGVVIGCQGRITYRGQTVDAVVADVSGSAGVGEMSIAAFKTFGFAGDPLGDDISGGVLFEFWPDRPAVIKGTTYNLLPA